MYYAVEVLPCEEKLITLVQNFYSTESFGTSMEPIQMSEDDKSALDALTSSIKNVGAGLEQRLPWKTLDKKVPDNRASALQRLKCVGKRLLKDAIIAERYINTINICYGKYVMDGHARGRNYTLEWFTVFVEKQCKPEGRIEVGVTMPESKLTWSQAFPRVDPPSITNHSMGM